MKQSMVMTAIALMTVVSAGPVLLAEESPIEARGEVVQVLEHVRSGNEGELDAVMIRTREGKRLRLLLGAAGTCDGCVQAGDQVRARLLAGNRESGEHQVRWMKVRRTGEQIQFRNEDGTMVSSRTRARAGGDGKAGDQNRVRTRHHTRDPGKGSTSGSRSDGGRGGRHGGGRQ